MAPRARLIMENKHVAIFIANWSDLSSIANSLHVLQEDLLTAAVIKFRGPAVGVAGDSLSGFKRAVIF